MMISRAALCLAVGLLFVGCGGGGGGGDSGAAPGANITVATYDQVGRSAAAVLLDMNAFSSLEKVHSVSESGGIDGGIMALSRLAVELGRQRFAGRESPAVFSNPAPYSVYYCENGGSLTWTGIDANSNGRIDAGDTVNLYVAACPLPVNSPPTTGKFDFVVNTATYNGDEPVAMAISATFSDLTTAGSTLNGRAELYGDVVDPCLSRDECQTPQRCGRLQFQHRCQRSRVRPDHECCGKYRAFRRGLHAQHAIDHHRFAKYFRCFAYF